MSNSTRAIVLAVALYAILAATGCSSLQTPPVADNISLIHVEFDDNIERLQEGDRVLLLGLPIGQTKKPFVLQSRAIVPVALQNARVLDEASRVYFLVVPDRAKPGRYCMVAGTYSTPDPGKPRFRGFTSAAKLNMQLATEKLHSWWNNLGVPK